MLGRFVRGRSKTDQIALAKRDRAKLERSGHVRVNKADPYRLRHAFKELGLPLIEAETGVGYAGGRDGGVSLYIEHWAMPKDLAAAQALARLIEETEKR